MSKMFGRVASLSCLLGMAGLITEAQGASTLSLRAIAKNGALITPTNNLSVAPGDTIIAEISMSGWSSPPYDDPANTGLVQTYQARLEGAAGAISNCGDPFNNNRLVLPVGWVAPVIKDQCPCDNASFPTCDPAYGCVGAGHNPAQMASLGGLNSCTASNTDTNGGSCTGACCVSGFRSDFIFFGFDNFSSADVSSLNVRFGGTINGTEGQSSMRCTGGGNAGGSCTTGAQCPSGTCDANYVSYGGTLNLKVGTQACGTYTFDFSRDINQTFIANPAANPVYKVPGTIQPLVLTVTGVNCPDECGPCCDTGGETATCTDNVHMSLCTGPDKRFGGVSATCGTINPPCATPDVGACCNEQTGICVDDVEQASCQGRWGGADSTCATLNPECQAGNTLLSISPPNCSIDARIPQVRNTPAQRLGYTNFVLTFALPLGSGENAPADFQIRQVPATAPPNPPVIHDVVPGPNNTLTLNFTASAGSTTPFPIQPRRWTCVKHLASGVEKCVGFQPADVDANGTPVPADIIRLVDNLNNQVQPPLPLSLCDSDRSGICQPADIITEVDMLNGNGFPAQNGQPSIGACPTPNP